MMDKSDKKITRRDVLRGAATGAAALGAGGVVTALVAGQVRGERLVWQLDPAKCIQCGNCQTNCVLTPSAVKCVHAFEICGYCDICTGFSPAKPFNQDTAAENQLCPTGAIRRTWIEDPYYEYTIDESRCVGCGKCVAGCAAFGNGSLFLQVRHDRCVHCNACNIAAHCPVGAYRRVKASEPYILKKGRPGA